MGFEQSRNWDAVDWDALSPDEFAELIIQRAKEAPPTITKAQLYDIEKGVQATDATRRAAIAVLAMPGSELMQIVVSGRETALAFAQLTEWIDCFLEKQQRVKDLVKSAQAKLLVALAQREDMHNLLDQATSEK